MTKVAYGTVIYGYKTEKSILRTTDGKIRVCSYRSKHEIYDGAYCPECGHKITIIDNLVPSQKVINYSAEHNKKATDVLNNLDQYEHLNNTGLVFGILLSECGTDSCSEFKPICDESRSKELNRFLQIIKEFGFDPSDAKYHLIVELL
jgi:hypothetical protein